VVFRVALELCYQAPEDVLLVERKVQELVDLGAEGAFAAGEPATIGDRERLGPERRQHGEEAGAGIDAAEKGPSGLRGEPLEGAAQGCPVRLLEVRLDALVAQQQGLDVGDTGALRVVGERLDAPGIDQRAHSQGLDQDQARALARCVVGGHGGPPKWSS
jgi:hypothetical protein